ncbi:MAG TPA: winged helix DNA-binding domain-containing protein [Solirubrobacteraceae bacterium]
MSSQSVVLRRLASQLLTGPKASDPVAVARRLLAIQGQDPRGARLAIRVRSKGLSAKDVDRALSEDRSLLITWLNRGTLHLVASDDYPWLHALTAPTLATASARRLAQEGVTPDAADRGVAVIEGALADEGPLDRAQLRERIDKAGVRTQGQALVHLLLLASLRGVAVRGPMVGAQHAYVLCRDWLGEQARVDRDRALAELARRYLVGHAPADDRDLAKWSGLPLRDVRAGLAAIAPELHHREDGLLELASRAAGATAKTRGRSAGRRSTGGRSAAERSGLPAPRLMGAFDPLLLGWRSRAEFLEQSEPIVTVNGLFRPFALVRARAVATWGLAGGEVTLKPFAPLAEGDERALVKDAEGVVRFLWPAG